LKRVARLPGRSAEVVEVRSSCKSAFYEHTAEITPPRLGHTPSATADAQPAPTRRPRQSSQTSSPPGPRWARARAAQSCGTSADEFAGCRCWEAVHAHCVHCKYNPVQGNVFGVHPRSTNIQMANESIKRARDNWRRAEVTRRLAGAGDMWRAAIEADARVKGVKRDLGL